MNDTNDIVNDADVKFRILISDSWFEVPEDVYNAWEGHRMMDGSDVGLGTVYEGPGAR